MSAQIESVSVWSSMLLLTGLLLGCTQGGSLPVPDTRPKALAPSALAASPDGRILYVACARAEQVIVWDTILHETTGRFAVPGPPSGLVLSRDGKRLVVTCAGPVSSVVVLDPTSGKPLQQFPAGHTTMSPVFGLGETSVFVCNRFNNNVLQIDLRTGRELARIPVAREPVSAALTPDGRYLLVANHLPHDFLDRKIIAGTVNLIEIATQKVVKELRLPNGSINLREIRVSPDGRHAAVGHTIARFNVPVTQLHRGWVNTSALTLLDLSRNEVFDTVLLDDPDRGAADPWALAWSTDGQTLCVTHAGTHELSLIDFPALLKKLSTPKATGSPEPAPSHDLSFLTGLRQRVKLEGNGPRALAVIGDTIAVAGYFSDDLEVVPLSDRKPKATPQAPSASMLHSLHSPNHPLPVPSQIRLGEMYFNDAVLCFQGWQSCATCHDNDARVDGLSWDLLNDGIGNPKDTKSLVWSHQTPPVMSLGVRATAEVAVRNGIVNSLASSLPEAVPAAMDAWIKSLAPEPSPYLVNGELSPKARQGKQIFEDAAVACASCHSGKLFTDLQSYSVGTTNRFDRGQSLFDTPTLRELWRTGPYLHDGSAVTIRDVLTTRNAQDEHGKTSHLRPEEIEALEQYVLSL